jgi:predicted MFS family arabinose efflux permease
MTIGSFSSGGLLSAYGWSMVLWVSFVPLALAVAVLMLSKPDTDTALGQTTA